MNDDSPVAIWFPNAHSCKCSFCGELAVLGVAPRSELKNENCLRVFFCGLCWRSLQVQEAGSIEVIDVEDLPVSEALEKITEKSGDFPIKMEPKMIRYEYNCGHWAWIQDGMIEPACDLCLGRISREQFAQLVKDGQMGADGPPLPQTMDAMVWAKEFVKFHGYSLQRGEDLGSDLGCMIGWFANSIMIGYDAQGPKLRKLEKVLLDIAQMPEIDQDDKYRLRGKAKIALKEIFGIDVLCTGEVGG